MMVLRHLPCVYFHIKMWNVDFSSSFEYLCANIFSVLLIFLRKKNPAFVSFPFFSNLFSLSFFINHFLGSLFFSVSISLSITVLLPVTTNTSNFLPSTKLWMSLSPSFTRRISIFRFSKNCLVTSFYNLGMFGFLFLFLSVFIFSFLFFSFLFLISFVFSFPVSLFLSLTFRSISLGIYYSVFGEMKERDTRYDKKLKTLPRVFISSLLKLLVLPL